MEAERGRREERKGPGAEECGPPPDAKKGEEASGRAMAMLASRFTLLTSRLAMQ